MFRTPSSRYFLLAGILIVFDQVTKLAVKGGSFLGMAWNGMILGESRPVIGDVLRWTFVENEGMAFGISFGAGKIILTVATIAIAGFLVWYLRRLDGQHWSVQLAVALILAGAVGNLIDRMFYGVLYGEGALMYGKVVDFIQVDIPDIDWFGERHTHFPVFNVADSCVSVGVVLLLFVSGKLPQPTRNGPSDETHEHDRSADDRSAASGSQPS